MPVACAWLPNLHGDAASSTSYLSKYRARTCQGLGRAGWWGRSQAFTILSIIAVLQPFLAVFCRGLAKNKCHEKSQLPAACGRLRACAQAKLNDGTFAEAAGLQATMTKGLKRPLHTCFGGQSCAACLIKAHCYEVE